MMRQIGFAAIALLTAGCATVPIRGFDHPAADQTTYMKDRYDCIQQAQQSQSSAYVNAYGGSSGAQQVTNGGVFASCMGARGYVASQTGRLRPPPGMEVYTR